MYIVIYFSNLNLVTSRKFNDLTEARTFAASFDWAKIVSFTESRTIVDVSLT